MILDDHIAPSHSNGPNRTSNSRGTGRIPRRISGVTTNPS